MVRAENSERNECDAGGDEHDCGGGDGCGGGKSFPVLCFFGSVHGGLSRLERGVETDVGCR